MKKDTQMQPIVEKESINQSLVMAKSPQLQPVEINLNSRFSRKVPSIILVPEHDEDGFAFLVNKQFNIILSYSENKNKIQQEVNEHFQFLFEHYTSIPSEQLDSDAKELVSSIKRLLE